MTRRYLGNRIHLETNPYGPGWRLNLNPFGRTAGYVAARMPWNGRSVHDPWWRRARWVSYIPAYTLTVATRQRNIDGNRRRRRLVVELRGGGFGCRYTTVPAWWA